MRIAALALAIAVTHASAAAPQTAPRPAFDVVSVKRNTNPPPTRPGPPQLQPGGRVIWTATTVQGLIGLAFQRYGFDNRELIGAPSWTDTDRFDIVAQAKGDLTGPDGFPGPLFAMMRSLLEERFALRVHEEQRERAVYLLVKASRDGTLGRNIRPASVDCAAVMRDELQGKRVGEPGQMRPCALGTPPGQLLGRAVTMQTLANVLRAYVGRPVVDRTMIAGQVDFELEFNPEFRPGFVAAEPGAAAPSGDGPSLFTALTEQLGLKLESGRAPVDVLVVDHVEPPSEN